MAFSSEFTQYAVAFLEQKTQRHQAPEDAIQIVRNLAEFFQVLHEWQKRDQNTVQPTQEEDEVAA